MSFHTVSFPKQLSSSIPTQFAADLFRIEQTLSEKDHTEKLAKQIQTLALKTLVSDILNNKTPITTRIASLRERSLMILDRLTLTPLRKQELIQALPNIEIPKSVLKRLSQTYREKSVSFVTNQINCFAKESLPEHAETLRILEQMQESLAPPTIEISPPSSPREKPVRVKQDRSYLSPLSAYRKQRLQLPHIHIPEGPVALDNEDKKRIAILTTLRVTGLALQGLSLIGSLRR